ncbi:MAG: hypothetical protein ABSB90_06955 [Thermoplasmata archaeon]
MAPRRTRRIPRPRKAVRPIRAASVPTVPAPSDAPMHLGEPPHSHIVCRNCGRIAAVDLGDEERELLVALASRHPEGWSVDGIAFSLTGACARCRQGPRA